MVVASEALPAGSQGSDLGLSRKIATVDATS